MICKSCSQDRSRWAVSCGPQARTLTGTMNLLNPRATYSSRRIHSLSSASGDRQTITAPALSMPRKIASHHFSPGSMLCLSIQMSWPALRRSSTSRSTGSLSEREYEMKMPVIDSSCTQGSRVKGTKRTSIRRRMVTSSPCRSTSHSVCTSPTGPIGITIRPPSGLSWSTSGEGR